MAGSPVRSVLFVCNMNAVRSPMAEALARHILGDGVTIESCGVYQSGFDPYAADVLAEIDVEPPTSPSRSFASVDPTRYDRVVAFTGEAAGEARRGGAKPEFWDVENPTEGRGEPDEMLAAYRELREELSRLIREHLT